MNNQLRLKLERVLNEEQNNLKKMKAELRKTPQGRLYMRRKDGKIYYYEYRNGKQIGLNKSMDRVYKMARRDYIRKCVEHSEYNVKMMRSALSAVDVNAKAAESMIQKYEIGNVLYSADDYTWMNAAYYTNNFNPEEKHHLSGSGNKFRSKSERAIAERMEAFFIPYRYEPMVKVENKTYFPDFMAKKQNGKLVIWEHFGLMDFDDYSQKAHTKIEDYGKIGFRQHTNLICTYEDDVEDLNNIDEIIMRFLL